MSMRTVATGAVLGGMVLGAGYLVLNQVRPYVQSTTNEMPAPKPLTVNADGRVYAVVQLCWRPAEISGTAHYVIGPIEQVVSLDVGVDCRTPFQRKGLVSAGDRVVIGWQVDPHANLRGVKYRITINNRPVMQGEEYSATKLYACIVGTPPC